MPRANRSFCPGLIWHLTHRCHQRQFLLRFARDRRRWRHWLFEARRRYGLCVLNFIVTSNHIHLLVRDRGLGEIAASMRLVAARTAQEYNQRKSRHGAFWSDRYHATAIQDDEHLVRCMTYIDLNMVRAGAVQHPAEWDVSGYAEIQKPRQRKAVIDLEVLCDLLGSTSIEQLAERMSSTAAAHISSTRHNPAWTKSVGVGDEAFLVSLQSRLGPRATHRHLKSADDLLVLKETNTSYSSQKGTEKLN